MTENQSKVSLRYGKYGKHGKSFKRFCGCDIIRLYQEIVSCGGVIMGYVVGIAIIFVIAIGIYSGLKNKKEE